MFNIPFSYKEAIDIIASGKQLTHDIGLVKYFNKFGEEKSRYFINIAGMGFDAMVAKKTNVQKDKGRGGTFLYFINIFSSLFSYRFSRALITMDQERINRDVFSMNVSICQYNGGGMKQAPFAKPDDGLFDITIIRAIGKFKVIRNVSKLFDGSFVKLPEVSIFTSSKVSIMSETPMYLEVDGESLGHSPFEFTIHPRSLKVIVG
jgi:diacylglycerol kinase family enzyme